MPILPKPIELTPELEVGFWERVPKGSPEQCWEWAGCLTAGGYGKMHHQKRGYMAHRLSVLIDSRELPDGMFVDHICRNRSCVNPLHLRVVTSAVNTLENSDSVAAVNAQKTHCDNGHEFSPRNTRTRHRDGRTMRVCRKCLVIDKRNHRHRKGAAMRAALPTNATTNEAMSDLRTAEFRLALGRITEHYPPDTIAGRLAADALAKHPNQFENADRENDSEPFRVAEIEGLPHGPVISATTNASLVEAATAVGSALDDWIKIIIRFGMDGDYRWARMPSHEEVQEAMRANNALAARLATLRASNPDEEGKL